MRCTKELLLLLSTQGCVSLDSLNTERDTAPSKALQRPSWSPERATGPTVAIAETSKEGSRMHVRPEEVTHLH